MESVADLGYMPLANEYVDLALPNADEERFELHAQVCENCLLVQVADAATPERLFSDYAYFSSYSETWLEHSKRLAHDLIEMFELRDDDLVIEIASNDGYLLKNFLEADLQVLGVEPARNIADHARSVGIPTISEFFGASLGRELAQVYSPRVIVGNNVVAHVPDINDFVCGLSVLAGDSGVIVLEFPHLLQLLKHTQFDTIYHEHFSYLSLHSFETILRSHGLEVFDVREVPTHGGSLRVFASRIGERVQDLRVDQVRKKEVAEGILDIGTYTAFAGRVKRIRNEVRAFFEQAHAEGRVVAGYGAAAKGNTLLNYCGLTADDMILVADLSPAKQGHLMPGSRIPIVSPEALVAARPEYIFILPWNLSDEIMEQMRIASTWGALFVTAIPRMRVIG